MSEETINYRIEYDVRGVDQSVRQTQRVLLFMNSIRLAAVDIQQVMSGPTLSNVLWTSIQLTRVWTNLLRVVKQTNQAQRIGLAQSMIGGGGIGGRRGLAAGQMTLGGTRAQQNLLQLIATGLGVSVPTVLLLGGSVIATAGLVYLDVKATKDRNDWIKKQREIAKSQGLEN